MAQKAGGSCLGAKNFPINFIPLLSDKSITCMGLINGGKVSFSYPRTFIAKTFFVSNICAFRCAVIMDVIWEDCQLQTS
jgi:hypothetical protein